jgi:hypothetical protein
LLSKAAFHLAKSAASNSISSLTILAPFFGLALYG